MQHAHNCYIHTVNVSISSPYGEELFFFFFGGVNLTPAPPPTRPLDALFFNNHSTCQNFQVVHLQHWTNVPLKRSSVIDLWLISVLSVYCMSDLTVYLNRWENLQYVEKKTVSIGALLMELWLREVLSMSKLWGGSPACSVGPTKINRRRRSCVIDSRRFWHFLLVEDEILHFIWKEEKISNM